MAQGQGRRGQPDNGIDLAPFANHVSARLLAMREEQEPACHCGRSACAQCQADRVDERLAVERAKKLFGADYANVRPHCASQAVEVVRKALLQTGDMMLDIAGLRAQPGKPVQRRKAASGEIDYARLRALARKHRPRIISARFPDACRALDFPLLRAIADEIDAYLYVDITPVAGMIAAGFYPNPVGVADVVSTATDGSLRGPAGAVILARSRQGFEDRIDTAAMDCVSAGAAFAAKAQAFKEALDDGFVSYQSSVIANAAAMLEAFAARGHDIVGNRNHDASFTVGPREGETVALHAARLGKCGIHVGIDTACTTGGAGMQIGASAITTRGFRLAEANALASLVCDLLERPDDTLTAARVRREAGRLRQRFPVPE